MGGGGKERGQGREGEEVQSGHLTPGAANSAAQISDSLGEGLERFSGATSKKSLDFNESDAPRP